MPRRRSNRRSTMKRAAPVSGSEVAYCVKCRQKRTMTSSRRVTTKRGRSMIKGMCPSCGTKMNKFV